MSELQRPSPGDESIYLNRSITPLFSDVFISYSRKDKDFVRRLFESLKASNRKSWVDWQDIPPTADFLKQIYAGIEAASTFVFILSPDSITPKSFSLKELDYALQNKKRIIPLVNRLVDPQSVREELQKMDWIFFTQDELFDYAFRRLLFALDIDMAYWSELAKLLTYAKEWERHGKDPSKFLRDKGLKEAKLLMQDGATKTPPPPPIVLEFLQRSNKQQITRRAMMGILGGVTLAGIGTPIASRFLFPENTQRPPSLSLPHTFQDNTLVTGVAWSPDGKRIASASGGVQIWDVSSGRRLLSYSHTGPVYTIAWSPDGKRIASCSSDHTVQVWDASSGTRLLIYTGHTDQVRSVAWSPNGKHIASGSDDTTVQIWDANSGGHLLTYTGHTHLVGSVAWSPDSKRIASASYDYSVQVWDASNGSRLLTYTGHNYYVFTVAWSPDGKRIASGSNGVRVWDASSGSLQFTYTGHTNVVSSVAWSPDGKRIASGSNDKTVQVWDASSGNHLLTYTGHTEAVWDAMWSPDGRRIASGSNDHAVQVWDASSGSRLLTYTGHTNAVYSVAWSHDGKRIASGSWDTTVRIWHVA